MGAYIVRRVAIGIVLLLVMSAVTFVLFFAAPVDPARVACPRNCPTEVREEARAVLGYDQPVYVQWGKFVKGIVAGRQFPNDEELREARPDLVIDCAAPCLGYSQGNARTVNDMISEAAPVTASLALIAATMWLTAGVFFGILAAVFKGTLIDRGVVGATLVIYAFPSFFVGAFLLKYVSIRWGWWPRPEYISIADGGIGSWAFNLLLPAFSLALLFTAGYVRMTRAFLLESLSEDYIRTARAKGLKNGKVLFKHGLRAALTPLVTLVGLDFATLLGGAVITENIFNMPGLGHLALVANQSLDLPTLVGLVILAASFVILANIVVDILYAVIDPRVRVG